MAPVRRRQLLSALFVVGVVTACTYGPEEATARVGQIVRAGDTFVAIAVVQSERFRQPTGLSAFPDGGKRRYAERHVALYRIGVDGQAPTLLVRMAAADSLWDSFEGRIVGVAGDSAAYLRLTGCQRDGECYPALSHAATYRVSMSGELTAVPEVPSEAALPGVMGARAPGERNYVRFGTIGDTITARLDETGTARRLFVVRADGTLVAAGS